MSTDLGTSKHTVIVLGLLLLALFLVLAAVLYTPSPPPNAGLAADHIGAQTISEVKLRDGGLNEHPIVGGGDYAYLGFVWHLDQPYARMPEAMALDAYSVFWCESRMDDGAVGKAGELGVGQVHKLHAPAMAQAGLDFKDGKDRMEWAVRLWKSQGWQPWTCGEKKP